MTVLTNFHVNPCDDSQDFSLDQSGGLTDGTSIQMLCRVTPCIKEQAVLSVTVK